MSLKNVNMNLMPVLRELLRGRSVAAAARALGRSSPAISESLAQLRVVFEDPLLVRTDNRMVLTPRAVELIDPVEEICRNMEAMLTSRQFDPAVTERLFVLAMPDHLALTVGQKALDLFRVEAPKFQLRFVPLSPDLGRRLASRDIDFVIIPDFHIGSVVTTRLHHRLLFEEDTVVLMTADHPLVRCTTIDAGQLAAFQHIAYHPDWESIERQSPLTAFHQQFRIVARSAQMTLLPFLLVATDYLALVPAGLAARMAPILGLAHRPLTEPLPRIKAVLAWSRLQEADPAHRWLRDRMEAPL